MKKSATSAKRLVRGLVCGRFQMRRSTDGCIVENQRAAAAAAAAAARVQASLPQQNVKTVEQPRVANGWPRISEQAIT